MSESTIIKPLDNEQFEAYRKRIYFAKEKGLIDMPWRAIANLFYDEYGVRKDESSWRRECQKLSVLNQEDASEISELNETIMELKKERIKLRDERTQTNSYLRRIAREETLFEIAQEVAEKLSDKKLLVEKEPVSLYNINNEAIVQLSDWHYGMEFESPFNKFDTDICKERVSKLLTACKTYFSKHPVKKIYVVNLGDLICGRIHLTLRLQSRIDVITQTIEVSEILAEFINELTSIAPVEYHDCLDNHSRLEPIKENALDLESMCRIIPWFLSYRLKDNSNVIIAKNAYDGDIIAFPALNNKYMIGGVHGHNDSPGKVVDNLVLLTKADFDMVLVAHYHHFTCDEKNECIVVGNSSLMGTDDYAIKKRLSAKPSQNIILITEDSVCDEIHRVVLN